MSEVQNVSSEPNDPRTFIAEERVLAEMLMQVREERDVLREVVKLLAKTLEQTRV